MLLGLYLTIIFLLPEDIIVTAYQRATLWTRPCISSLRTKSQFAVYATVSEKKKKNLLPNDITIRDSTITLSTGVLDNPFEKRRRGPNIGYALIRRTLLHYKMRYGDMLVPTAFVVPADNDDWPQCMWNMNLGKIVQTLRSGRKADKKDDLLNIGFCYNIHQLKFETVKTALLTFKEHNGDFLVPRYFSVPNNTIGWPEETWNMNLGNIVSNIRSGISSYLSKREELLEMGFCFDVLNDRYELIIKALLCYNELSQKSIKYQNVIHKDFVVPESNEWPKETWGIRLGDAMRRVRRGNNPMQKKKEILNLGHSFIKRKRVNYEVLKAAVDRYKELNGSVNIPIKYKISMNDPDYPEESWGLQLGSLLGRIKRGEKWLEKRSEIFPSSVPKLKKVRVKEAAAFEN